MVTKDGDTPAPVEDAGLDEPLWTVRDVAKFLQLKPETVRAMVRRGELKALRVGRRALRFKRAEVRGWAERQQIGLAGAGRIQDEYRMNTG
ncbi:MAG: helix-turn-helix domain-containing protein [Chloroflexi bacterium]|nr:helix-turn-helix domain-containing protein [Chloroflexota bacterium]